jgi:DNA replication protein DnaC
LADDAAIPASDPTWRQRVLGLDHAFHPSVDRLAKTIEWFCRACLRNNRSKGHQLVLAGGAGVGKTHCARIAATYIGERQIDAYSRGWLNGTSLYSPAFVRWNEIADAKDHDWDAILTQLIIPARVVIIDDVGAETDQFRSGVPNNRLKTVLDDAERKWLLVTTNVPKARWEAEFGVRNADRLLPAHYLSLFSTPSYRDPANRDRSTAAPPA